MPAKQQFTARTSQSFIILDRLFATIPKSSRNQKTSYILAIIFNSIKTASMHKIAAFILIILAVALIYLGTKNGILPPTLTGIGFIAIALAFMADNRK
ncbi:MAG: hypothetical protein EA358_11305 [Flavobacteriales bacterium]|nr:MAG: hypothetical protein EA358_11305 [Flavobacteriales bacterium]